MLRRAFGTLAVSLALAGCTTATGYYARSPASGQPASLAPPAAGGVVPAPSGRRVAILLPLSGPHADLGQAMLKAAQLALAVPGAPQLDPHDTQGTPDGAAAAARAAVQGGDGIILGPLTSGDTAAVTPIAKAAGVAVLAFTNDPARAQPGVWPLGITPDQQVRRLIGAVSADGHDRFAALLPEGAFGAALSGALSQATTAMNLPPPRISTYGGGFNSINVAARSVSDYADRRGPIDAQIRAARAQLDATGRQKARELAKQSVPPPPFDALLLAATGEQLKEVLTLLPYYDIYQPTVRFLGPTLWAAHLDQLGGVAGAWYPAPDPAARADFVARYAAANGAPPPPLADIAFDAAAIARVVGAEGHGFPTAALTAAEGFAGTDGVLALLPDGHVRRGLAVFQVDPGGASHIVSPAPTSLSAPGV